MSDDRNADDPGERVTLLPAELEADQDRQALERSRERAEGQPALVGLALEGTAGDAAVDVASNGARREGEGRSGGGD